VSAEELSPEWCLVGNLLPYPYSTNGPQPDYRSQKIFPAGAKLYVLGGFAGAAYDTITVIGYGHHRRHPVRAHIQAKYVGGWRAQLVYRPVILRAIYRAQDGDGTCHRWLDDIPQGRLTPYSPTEPEYGDLLARLANDFQRRLHGPAD
jgi:hypothetical protein